MPAANTFEPVAREWHENWKPGRTEYYAWQVMRRLEADVFPEVGGRPINEIEPPELLDMLRKVESRGAHETALRIKQLVGQIFRYAIVTSRAKRDTSADLKGALKSPAKTQHHRSMPRDELPAFLRGLEAYEGERRTSLALKLVTLTFLRTTELRAGQWPEIEDLDGLAPLWRVPPERMKKRREHLVPLPRQAVPVLKEHDSKRLNIIASFGQSGAISWLICEGLDHLVIWPGAGGDCGGRRVLNWRLLGLTREPRGLPITIWKRTLCKCPNVIRRPTAEIAKSNDLNQAYRSSFHQRDTFGLSASPARPAAHLPIDQAELLL